ncbi:alpha/beta hydrolase [Gordonia polyisoprenivorans]|nr:alpha/beta hydrolase [Gordonia polyisoprenivorans]
MADAHAFTSTHAGRQFFDHYQALRERWPTDATDADLPSRFGTTHTTSWGRSTGTDLMLLPGAGATLTEWFAVARSLGRHRRCHTVDFIGDPGLSVPGRDRIRSVDDVLEWLETTMTSLHAARPILVGHSYGAMVALAFALRHPEQVSGLVLLDPNSCFGPMRMQYLAHAVPILLRPSRSRQRKFLEWETGGAALDHQWLELSAIGAAHFPSTRPRVPRRPKTATLAGLAVPVSVILAANSRVHDVGKIADSARNSLPHCHIDIIDGATHHSLPMLPQPAVTTVLTSTCTQFAGG